MSGDVGAVSETVFSVFQCDVCSSYCLCSVTRGTRSTATAERRNLLK